MRIEATEARERKWKNLKEATGKGHKSTALDTAADYYLKMFGETIAAPTGAVEELMELATEQGSVTPKEIADVLDTDELPVEIKTSGQLVLSRTTTSGYLDITLTIERSQSS